MAAPRRALTGTLLRAAAQSTLRAAARPAIFVPARTATSTSGAWRALAAPRTRTGLRWYSAENESKSRNYSFDDVQEQLNVNDELEASGKEATEAGKRKAIFVDVREPEELLQTGRIPGAINIPVTSAIQSFHISDEDFSDMYGYDRPPKDAHLVFYCKAGVRARSAAGLAQHAGWESVGVYPGSWLEWSERNGAAEVKYKTSDEWHRAQREDSGEGEKGGS